MLLLHGRVVLDTALFGLTSSDADILERWKDLVESGVAFEGPLQKLKSKARMLGSWNKRFFVLDYEKREFLYFASQSQARHPCGVPSGSVKFEDLLTARSTGTNLFQVRCFRCR